jgi:hypothetical protein
MASFYLLVDWLVIRHRSLSLPCSHETLLLRVSPNKDEKVFIIVKQMSEVGFEPTPSIEDQNTANRIIYGKL